ncbi:MBL fold metallo-hydrolase [Haloferula sp. BvORR071]|uniref:MBL fold metallo-hydrolase n=1 Tax=Haloferula sp. BvORR071 TaxID=1396141 RepID=UPI0006965183|nr:MBL fold metallo-hydrolase [Haloferula sp. BvORR071]
MPRFSNPWVLDEGRSFADVFRWKFGRMPADEFITTDDNPASRVPYTPQAPPAEGWRVTWLGHASFLLQGCGKSILIDPVFSDHCAPFRMERFKRLVPPPCKLEDLPSIDAVLLTHAHYDHLDLATLRKLGADMPLVSAEGHSAWLRRKGFRQVQELAWFQQLELFPGIRITATPAQHFTARTPFDRNCAHWCGWLLEGAGLKLWHAGDSGYCPGFREIGERLGPIDFAMIPIGAYSPRWFMSEIHMDPAEAVKAFQDARCQRAVAMHWGTFRLTDEPMSEPPLRLQLAAEAAGIADRFTSGAVGESWEIAQR